MRKKVNYNYIAPYYDWLCQLVFGQKIINAQVESLHFIPANSNILIIGGGTGWILDEITAVHPRGLHITYIDISSKMIQLSKKRFRGANTIIFINEAIEDAKLLNLKFDVILVPFFFDGFSEENLLHIFKKLDNSLRIGGLLLYVDFHLPHDSKWWQNLIIKVMYLFFRLVCNIEASKLPQVNSFFSSYKKIWERVYCDNLIYSLVLRKGTGFE